jgi:hypothetical protein
MHSLASNYNKAMAEHNSAGEDFKILELISSGVNPSQTLKGDKKQRH